MLPFLFQHVREPWVVAPVELYRPRIGEWFFDESLVRGIGIKLGIPRHPNLGPRLANGRNQNRPAPIRRDLPFLDPNDIEALEGLDRLGGKVRKARKRK